MANLFYNDSNITSVAQIIQLLKNDDMDLSYLNENITNKGIEQLELYLRSQLKPTIYSSIIHQTIENLKENLDENKDIEYIYNEFIIDLFIQTVLGGLK